MPFDIEPEGADPHIFTCHAQQGHAKLNPAQGTRAERQTLDARRQGCCTGNLTTAPPDASDCLPAVGSAVGSGVPGANSAVVEAVCARAALIASLLPLIPTEAAAQIAAAVPPRRHMKSKPMDDLGAFPKPLPEKDIPRELFRNG